MRQSGVSSTVGMFPTISMRDVAGSSFHLVSVSLSILTNSEIGSSSELNLCAIKFCAWSSSVMRAIVAVHASFFAGIKSIPRSELTTVDLPEDIVAMTLASKVGSTARSNAACISCELKRSAKGASSRLPDSKSSFRDVIRSVFNPFESTSTVA